MLVIKVEDQELYDEKNNSFIYIKGQTLQLEHSLLSVHKWESKWKKTFFSKTPMSLEETIDYIKCMTITQNVNDLIYLGLTKEDYKKISDYINDPMTATTFRNDNSKKNNEIVTSELIYYWMISLNIPFECQKWHLNKLLTLIKVCNIKNNPGKKMSKRDIYSQNKALNEARRLAMNSSG